ncbi:hypothetical protein [Lutibacter sp.]|uniref:hypothetical protein n=1 Tax=Lutibacter sp. TaxID=1925666 RepID=UPI00356679E7
MTLYEFNRLNDEGKLKVLWDKGIFLDNHISKTEAVSCYAIDMFFVEAVYDIWENKIKEVRSFKSGHRMDKIFLI